MTDGSSSHLPSIFFLLKVPAPLFKQFPGTTFQMVRCNNPSGASGWIWSSNAFCEADRCLSFTAFLLTAAHESFTPSLFLPFLLN